MTKYEQLKETLLAFRRTNGKKEANVLTFLLGEIDRNGKDHSDEVVSTILGRVVKQLKDAPNPDKVEILLIESFLAPELTGDELRGEVLKMILALPDRKAAFPKIMKQLAQQRDFRFNGKEAAQVVKELTENL